MWNSPKIRSIPWGHYHLHCMLLAVILIGDDQPLNVAAIQGDALNPLLHMAGVSNLEDVYQPIL